MKKIVLLLSVVATIAYIGCKKQNGTVSQVVTVSYPVITFDDPKNQYYSFTVNGGPLPDQNVIQSHISAHDTFYTSEHITPVVDVSTLTNLVPGLYIATVSAKNSHGFVGYNYVYVAITNIADTINLGGKYIRAANNDTVHITKLARGLYRTDNVGGELNTPATAPLIVPAYFAQTSSIDINMPMQATPKGNLYGTGGVSNMIMADTTIQYIITGNTNFAGGVRTFKKL